MNLFNKIRDWLSNSPVVILIFLASLAMLFIGAVHFCEDTYSTYAGIKIIETLYHIKPATWGITYVTMSLAFSIGQMVTLYIYLVDTDKHKWAWLGYAALMFLDTVTDVYYRSRGFNFAGLTGAGIFGNVVGSIFVTILFYTLFSEIFLTMGFALTFELFVPAIVEWKKFKRELGTTFKKTKDFIQTAEKTRTSLSGAMFSNRLDFSDSEISPYKPTGSRSLAEKHHPADQTRRVSTKRY